MSPRTILAAALLSGLTLAAGPSIRPVRVVSAKAPDPPPADEFRKSVYPVLSARCGACHDPGGRMYDRLPFDDPKTITSHSAGVLRRLKGDDRAAVERWLAGLAPQTRAK